MDSINRCEDSCHQVHKANPYYPSTACKLPETTEEDPHWWSPTTETFQKQWELKLLRNEIASTGRTPSLEEELAAVRERAQHLEEQVQLKTSRYSENTSRPEQVRKRHTEEPGKYSKSHQFRLKRQRKNDCVESLKWMEQEGYTPLQIEIKNNRTGKLETFVLQEDLEATFGPDAGSATDSDLDLISMML